MIQTIEYTTDELRSMLLFDKRKGEKSSPVIIFDGKPVHEITDATALRGEVFRSGKHRSGLAFEASNFGRIKYNGVVLPQHEESEKSNGYLVVDVAGSNPILVYQIVADIWLKKPSDESGLQVHHITNNGYDNRPQNLVWVTKAEHDKIHF